MAVVIPCFVVGAGGHGRDVRAIIESTDRYMFAGFLDDKPELDDVEGPVSLLGEPGPEHFVIGVNDSIVRKQLEARICFDRNAATLIHPTAVTGPAVHVRPGAVIAANVVLTTGVVIGRHTHINVGATVSQGSSVGDFGTVGPGAHICGDVSIARGVQIGAGATVVQLRALGTDAIVGAGAVVLQDVPEGATVVGVPARRIK